MILKGMKLVECDSLVITSDIPSRRNKSKRIQKKWIKKYGYKKIPDPNIYVTGTKLMAHPKIIKLIMKEINDNEKRII